jgi:hypothetical protein
MTQVPTANCVTAPPDIEQIEGVLVVKLTL